MRDTSASFEALAPCVHLDMGTHRVYARPISAECARWFDVEAQQPDPARRVHAVVEVLRAAFPARYALRAALAIPVEGQHALLRALFRVPDSRHSPNNDDVIARIMRQQRAEVRGTQETAPLSKEVVTRMVQIACGQDYYLNRRWPTVDGFVPWAECVLMFEALETARSQQRLSDVMGWSIANGTKNAQSLFESTVRQARGLDA